MFNRSHKRSIVEQGPPIPGSQGSRRPLDQVFDSNLELFHARIAVRQTRGSGLPLLFLHGPSGTKETFDRQLRSALGQAHRCIAIDLPGYGESADLYEAGPFGFIRSYAEAAGDVMEALDIDRFAVIGHAMGGDVAIEMMTCVPNIVGVFVSGTVPADDSDALASEIPLALVDGDNAVPKQPWTVLNYPHLWTGARHAIPGAGPAPFIDAAPLYNHLLSRFAHEMGLRAHDDRASPRLAYSA